MAVSTSDIQIFFDNYGVALATSDLPKIVNAWSIPSLVINGENSVAVSNRNEVEEFFKCAISDYQSNGITSTTPSIQKVDCIAPNLTAVHVNWDLCSHDGINRGAEAMYYVIREHKKNQFIIDFCAAISPLEH